MLYLSQLWNCDCTLLWFKNHHSWTHHPPTWATMSRCCELNRNVVHLYRKVTCSTHLQNKCWPRSRASSNNFRVACSYILQNSLTVVRSVSCHLLNVGVGVGFNLWLHTFYIGTPNGVLKNVHWKFSTVVRTVWLSSYILNASKHWFCVCFHCSHATIGTLHAALAISP